MLKTQSDINSLNGPGIITAAVWAIIMIQIQGFIALKKQGNGIVY